MTQMKFEGIILSEIGQTEKDEYSATSLVSITQKKKANSQKQGRLMTAKTWDVG